MAFSTIPQPRTLPFVGNLPQLDPDAPIQSFMRLATELGPIYRVNFPARSIILLSSQELVSEVCDEQRFDKRVSAPLAKIRDFAGDGLFTAETSEPNWGKAHRLLMPAFGPVGIRSMFDPMLEIADQMLLRWERFGEGAVIDVADHTTRLTLDTIALCAFDYRFNSFYQNEMHPFVDAMVGGLSEAGARTRRPDVLNRVLLPTARRYHDDIRLMHDVADRLIAERRAEHRSQPPDDLLHRMLTAKDPLTGEGLSDENIRFQMVTFLIAGHETTSGLLSFALHLLLSNPAVLARARGAVDDALGAEMPTIAQLTKLRYLEQVLMETLRLWPTAPAFAMKAKANTVIGGTYRITTDDTLMVLLPMLHRDPNVWGPDVEAFRPERFDRDAEAALPPHAWKPFGHGQRACIGRPFAMQEAVLVLSLILQRFDLIAADPAYELRVKETLTLKPQGFRLRAKRRNPAPFKPRSAIAMPERALAPSAVPIATGPMTPLLVLYGSNTGSAQAFAQRIGSEATAHGYAAEVAPMDEHAGKLPRSGAVIVVTASYEGEPPDNARHFVASLGELEAGSLAQLHYTVFGCGSRQWARTYQAIPTRVDRGLASAGAKAFKARGEADASGDFFGAFDDWYETFWTDLDRSLGREDRPSMAPAALTVEVVTNGRSALLRQEDLAVGVIVESRELVDLTSPLGRSKRHFEVQLPVGMTYRAGDYLAILPRNPPINVERALRRFGFAADTQIVIHKPAGALTSLPTEVPIAAGELLASYVELAQPATRAQVTTLAAKTRCPPERGLLDALAGEATYAREVLDKRVSVLDLLERAAACELDFEGFLAMLPPLRARQYSISSSPLADATRCSLTVAIVEGPATSGQGRYLGVASQHLATSPIGTRVTVAVRPSHRHFHPPIDPRTPIIMIAAGTGIAPFRGFLQERALQARAGRSVGKALLFFGCDHPEVDLLYRDELSIWAREGVVELHPAYTHAPVDGCPYVQDRVWRDRASIQSLFRAGAVVYVCGDGKRMAPAVRETLARIYETATGASADAARRSVEEVERDRGRFVEDVFA